MSVKRGYKQTDVGVIPEEWEVRSLSSLSTEIGDGIHATPNYVAISDFYFINGNNLVNDQIRITDGTMCVSESEYRAHQKPLSQRTLLLSINGTIGNTAKYNREKVILGKSAAYINVAKSESRSFVSYCLKSHATALYFENELTGTTIRNLSLQTLRNTPIAVPPTIDEQRAIAAALSDVDALIASLDRLIAKKRDLKQAAMQQLLTGQTRLPGFGGKWETAPLGKIGAWFSGGTPSKAAAHFWEGTIPWVSPKDMKVARLHDAIDHVSSHAIGNGTRLLPLGAILVVVRGMILAHSAPVARAERALAFNQDIKGLVVREGVDSDFILWWLVASESTLLSKTNESTHGTKRIPTESLFALPLSLPGLAEQAAIAAVLTDMDAELTALEQRRDKTKLLKQGMMQELLTGKTRLV